MESLPTSLVGKLQQIDYIGITLLVGGLAAFLAPLTWGVGGGIYTWNSWHTICPIVIGGMGLLAFGVYEHRFARYPTIPLTIFQNRTVMVSYAGTVMHGLVLWCLLYYLPLYYEAVKEYSPIMSGVAFFPESFTVAPSAMVTGIIITYTGSYWWAIWLGWTISTLGIGLLCYMKVGSSIPAWVFLNIVPGLGLGLLFPALCFAVQASSTVENMAIATAMFSFSRALGNTIGVAVGGVIFQNSMRRGLQAKAPLALMAEEYSQDAARMVGVIKQMPADLGWKKELLKEAYTDSVRMIWAVCCGITGVGLLSSLLTEGRALNQPLEGNQQL
ncbi:MFS general substrate transporter, partial [Aspergillus novofumigatus IBT 16806]